MKTHLQDMSGRAPLPVPVSIRHAESVSVLGREFSQAVQGSGGRTGSESCFLSKTDSASGSEREDVTEKEAGCDLDEDLQDVLATADSDDSQPPLALTADGDDHISDEGDEAVLTTNIPLPEQRAGWLSSDKDAPPEFGRDGLVFHEGDGDAKAPSPINDHADTEYASKGGGSFLEHDDKISTRFNLDIRQEGGTVQPTFSFGQVSADIESVGSIATSHVSKSYSQNLPAQSVIGQIKIGAAKKADGRYEITLSPEELGKVRMEIIHGETCVVKIWAERAVTRYLLQSNMADLKEAFRDDGIENIDVSLSGDFDQNSDRAYERKGQGIIASSSPATEDNQYEDRRSKMQMLRTVSDTLDVRF